MNASNKHIVLEFEKLSVGYSSNKQTTVVLKNLNVAIKKGSFNCILGKNGVGKSTLLRTISKVQKPISGEVFINGENLKSINSSQLAKTISLVLTEKLPDSNLTVFELIALGRQPYTNWIDSLSLNDFKIIEKAMLLTKIEHLANKKYYELSDGQFQRVLIARALAQDTDIIIFDEPTAHLDIHHTLETFKLLQELSEKENKTIIISTHQIQLAIQTSEQLFLMTEDGLNSGTPQELIESKKIENLFKNEGVIFDYKKEQFTLKD